MVVKTQSGQKNVGNSGFDLNTFLNTSGPGRSIANYATGESIFSQDEAADWILYIQKGTVKLTVVSKEGKEAIIGQFDPLL